jgi:uncharacterized protein YgiM (DUF1202 family)
MYNEYPNSLVTHITKQFIFKAFSQKNVQRTSLADDQREGLMKRLDNFVVAILLLSLTLTACSQPVAGPSAWIDRPLDNSTHPLAPLIIQAHASDTSGVASFEFVVDDATLTIISATGGRLSEASYEWTPSAPGTYTIKVRATNAGGDVGAFASSRVTIGGSPSPEQAETATPTPDVVLLEDTPTTVAQSAETTFASITSIECGPIQNVFINISIGNPQGILGYSLYSTWADVSSAEVFTDPLPQLVEKRIQLTEPIDTVDRQHQFVLAVEMPESSTLVSTDEVEPGGRCAGHLHEIVVEPDEPTAPLVTARTNANCRGGPGTGYDIITSLSEGQSAAIEGRNTESSWWAIDPGVGGKTCWISVSVVDVSGDISGVAVIAPPPLDITDTPTPTLEPTVTPSPTVELITDTTPPSFYNTDVSPDSILTEGSGCPAYERTTTAAALVADENGLSSVVAYWNIGTENGQAAMQEGSMGHWTAIGPVNTAGTLEIYIIAQDTFGNIAQSDTLYVTVQDCVE